MFEEKEKEYLISLISSQTRQRRQLYNYLNFLSCKTDDYRENYLNYKFNYRKPANEAKIDISEEEIVKKNENFLKFIENEMSDLFRFLEKLKEYVENWSKINPGGIQSPNEMYDYYKHHKIKSLKNYRNKEIMQRSDLLGILFQNMMNLKEDSMVRESIKTDVRLNNIRNKFLNKMQKQSSDIERSNDIISHFKEYIQKNYKDSPMKLSLAIINLQIKNVSPKLLHSFQNKRPSSKLLQINIKIYPINIIIGFYLNKELIYNNYKFIFTLKEEYKRQANNDFILHKKIKILFYERIISILNMIYEEKRRLNINNTIIIFDEEYSKEFLKRFIHYINDYNLVNKIKCNLCQNNAKFSYVEKCFLPPFYKLYKEKENLPPGLKTNNNDSESKLFFHEECFKKMANPYL